MLRKKIYANFKLHFSEAYGELIKDEEFNDNPYADVNYVYTELLQEETSIALIMIIEATQGDKEASTNMNS